MARSVHSDRSVFRLSDDTTLEARRFLPLGQGDTIVHDAHSLAVLVKRENIWLEIGPAWSAQTKLEMSGIELAVTFKEIETAAELELFQQLRQFHYRGGGGAGRILPLIGTVDTPDLPRVIGFVELTSSMIANTARKRFFDGPYREPNGLGWTSWDRNSSRELSSLICRISRFVIHPELRGLGLARHFAKAAIGFARDRWHYGGYRPRFLEITADMLRYYPFVSEDFAYIGETEGNQHRVSKDMNYLVRRALSDEGVKAMPQGGGGIMSLQRGYATTLLDYIHQTGDSLEQAVAQLQYDPAALDQQSWEKLHRLNRRPKPCYVAGLTDTARSYVAIRAVQMSANGVAADRKVRTKDRQWRVSQLRVDVEADIVQSRDGRLLQDAFGFVGSSLGSIVVPPLDFTIRLGQISLVCGASGAGKSLFLRATEQLLQSGEVADGASGPLAGLNLSGTIDGQARIGTFSTLDPECAPLDLLGTASLGKMLMLAARCGLAEPQLLVRPIWTLSSGQKYRLQIALALLRDPEIILIDNFCESLDRFSTRAVCKGLSTLARELNIAAVLATAAYDRLSECLQPDQVIMLRRGDEPMIRKGLPLEI
jgi:energy-coupling factor transporter ATP-binding protein EcfA2/GNAT superfamily N-acetyltransferase